MIQFSKRVISVESLRVLMTSSSNTCDTHGPADQRNCLGFAVNEVISAI